MTRAGYGQRLDQEAFQRAAIEFLEHYAPPQPADDPTAFAIDEEVERTFAARGRAWQRTKFDHGWAGISWPEEFGGRGGSPIEEALFREVESRYVSPWLTHNLGFENAGAPILAHGDDRQREHFIPSMLRGEQIWTLLLSEPGAGSDLGALRTRAEREGDAWVVNGQKVWSSRAHLADFGLLVTRTNIDVPKYHGVTCFVLDMRTPGISVRPLKQMNGASHFNEVFLTDVRVPDDAVLGVPDHGWDVVRTTLSGERNLLGVVKSHITLDELLELAVGTGTVSSPVLRQRLARAVTSDMILSMLSERVRAASLAGRDPGPVGSVIKLSYSAHVTSTCELALDLLGAGGMLAGSEAPGSGRWLTEFTGAPATRIGGGTDEVARTTIAERVLGLPRDARPDKLVPFRDLKSS